MLCHAEAIKRDATVFLGFSLGSRLLFLAESILYMAPGSDVNTLLDLGWRGEEKKKSWGEKGGYSRGCVQSECKVCVCVCVSISLSLHVSVCVRAPLNSSLS